MTDTRGRPTARRVRGESGPSTSARPPSGAANKKQPLIIRAFPGETEGMAIARERMRPTIQGAVTLCEWGHVHGGALSGADINGVVGELQQQAQAASSNDLSRLEAMLAVQAHSLDAMFNECARRAKANMFEYPDAFDRYMRIALKAQNQCRTTIETLAEIKNPKPFVAVAQANLANGPQQVNNGISGPVRAPAHARAENSNPTNELLEHQGNGTRLEQRASSLTGKEDSALAAVGKVNGSAHR